MKNPIVVGVNDTASSQAGVIWATRRAAALKLPVLLIHAVDDRWTSDTFVYGEELRKYATEILHKAKSIALETEPSVKVRTIVASGSTGAILRKHSRTAEMVVIGSGHAWPGGPVTDRALQIAAVAHCQVAVVGENGGDGDGILVGADGSEESTQAVAFAAAEADRTGQQPLTVLHAFHLPPPQFQRGIPEGNFAELVAEEERVVLAETVAGLAEEYPDLTVKQVLVTDREPAKALLDAARGTKLLVLGSRGRGAFKRLLLGSTAHAVLAQLPCPTIITRVRRGKDTK